MKTRTKEEFFNFLSKLSQDEFDWYLTEKLEVGEIQYLLEFVRKQARGEI